MTVVLESCTNVQIGVELSLHFNCVLDIIRASFNNVLRKI